MKEALSEIVWPISSPKKNGQGTFKSLESPRLGAWLRPERDGTNRNINNSFNVELDRIQEKW